MKKMIITNCVLIVLFVLLLLIDYNCTTKNNVKVKVETADTSYEGTEDTLMVIKTYEK